jgi:hypothetical protein
MSVVDILLPVFVQVALTFVVLLILALRRFRDVSGKKLRGPVALREANWPDRTRQAEYNYQNQFELPVLFYVLMILLIITRQADMILMMLAWIFVALRVVHAAIHLTSNDLKFRGPFFIVGAIILMLMWGIYILRMIAVH